MIPNIISDYIYWLCDNDTAFVAASRSNIKLNAVCNVTTISAGLLSTGQHNYSSFFTQTKEIFQIKYSHGDSTSLSEAFITTI